MYPLNVNVSSATLRIVSTSLKKISGECASPHAEINPWMLNGNPIAVGRNYYSYTADEASLFGGCTYMGSITTNVSSVATKIRISFIGNAAASTPVTEPGAGVRPTPNCTQFATPVISETQFNNYVTVVTSGN